MSSWSLPCSVNVNGAEYEICTDYRDVLEVVDVLQDIEKHESLRVLLALSLFYNDFNSIPEDDHQQAFKEMCLFINCGEPDDGTPQPKTIDWEQDRMIIAAEINKVAGTEVRALNYLHWWTFISYFNSIGEGQLSYIVSIREKLRRGKKLERHEKEFYDKNRSRVNFKQKISRKEQEYLNEWIN